MSRVHALVLWVTIMVLKPHIFYFLEYVFRMGVVYSSTCQVIATC